MKYGKILRRLIKYPVISKEIYLYLKNDLLSRLGFYDYNYRILFIAGLAKSGSSWVGNMLASIPGYNLRSINDPKGVAGETDICDPIFSSLPKNGYSVMKLHTRFSEENFQIIRKYTPKFIVTYRDLRDMSVSRYFHIIVDPKHRHYDLYNRLTREEGILHSIDVVEKTYVSWVKNWIDASYRYKDMILAIKYEDLIQNTFDTIKRILEFYDFKLSEDFIRSLAATKITKNTDLGSALKKDLPGRLRKTARKGVVGDWVNYFNDKQKKRFKAIAGDLLIELGYEKDLNW